MQEIKFIRELSEEGQLIILKIYENYAVETFYPPYHISDVNGVGGYNSLLYFCLLLESAPAILHRQGEYMPARPFSEKNSLNLFSTGKVHPLTIAEKLPNIHLVE